MYETPCSPWQARQGARRGGSGSAAAAGPARAKRSKAPSETASARGTPQKDGGGNPPPLRCLWHSSAFCDLGIAVGDPVDRPGVVVRNEHGPVLHDLHVDRPPDIPVVLEKAREERLLRAHGPVLVQHHHDDVAADLLGPVP